MSEKSSTFAAAKVFECCMTILCIETSTNICSAAVCVDGVPVDERISREGGNHAKLLPSFVEQLLRSAAEQHRSIEAVAVSAGPGSYTGLRIGTSTAKGLCYGLQVPLVAVPTLQILSAAAIAAHTVDPDGILCPMLDARRMEVYTALYDSALKPLTEVRAVVVENEQSLSGRDATTYYFGDGAAKCAHLLPEPQWHYIADVVPEAKHMGVLAEKRLADGQGMTAAQMAYYEPFYLKEFVAAQSHVKGLKS